MGARSHRQILVREVRSGKSNNRTTYPKGKVVKIAFLDTETTGLDALRHEMWELAFILREDEHDPRDSDQEYIYQFWPTRLDAADPTALKVNRFFDRVEVRPTNGPGGLRSVYTSAEDSEGGWIPTHPMEAAPEIASRLDGAIIIGSNPAFDALHHIGMLDRWLRRNGAAGTWHYRAIDIWPLAYGFWLGQLNAMEADEFQRSRPFLGMPSDMLYAEIAGNSTEHARHTALGDCRMARDVWDAIHR
jgi:hypothetical protein